MAKRKNESLIHGGTAVRLPNRILQISISFGLAGLLVLALSASAFAQGSIFGTVTNADLTTPANGEVSFVGYLDDTDEEIRIESSDGGGYDAGNWFDDFQNYLTEAAGNPYDYHFYNAANGEGFVLSAVIPNNSFQQENVTLALVGWPVAPSGLSGTVLSGSSAMINWTGVPGLTYHVYRRMAVSNGSFFRIDDPTGTLTNPGVADSFFVDLTTDGVSSYTYLIIGEDPGGNLSPHSVGVTVNAAVADAPVLVSVDPTNGTALGGSLVNVYGSGFDLAGATVAFGAASGTATVLTPFHLTVLTPPGAVGATVDVIVTNTASAVVSNTLVGGFVYSANADPILAAIGAQGVVEGAPLQFIATATDLDGNTPVMTTSALPGAATFIDNGDGTGSFDWTPTFVDAGVYNLTFYATDAIVGSSVDSELVVITITEAGNQTPVLAAINDTTITETQTLDLVISASDADGEFPTLSVTNGPLNSTFTDNLNGTADFSFTPDFTQAGDYSLIFKALDGALEVDSIIVLVSVTDVNQLPVLTAIGPIAGTENIQLSLRIEATDADGVVPVLTTSALPGTALFVDSLNGAGSLDWTPTFADAGVYNVTFYATDAAYPLEVDSELVVITIGDGGNQAPSLAAIINQTVAEGGNLLFVISATDPDGTIPTMRAENLPVNATFTDNADGTGTFDFNPDFLQAGIYSVTFIAEDGLLADSAIVDVAVVEAGNIAPVIDSVGDFTINEGDSLGITISVTDPDGAGIFPALSISTTLTNYTFVDNGDGTGRFDYGPDFFSAGVDTVNFFATDFGAPQQTAAMQSIITTADLNQAPVIDSVGPLAVAVGDSLIFTITATDATDPDSSHRVLLSTIGLPANAAFVDNGDGTGLFAIVPDISQAGLVSVTFLAVDQGTPQLSVTLAVDINVVTENEPPILTPVGPQVIVEGQTLTINLAATDPDGPAPSIEASGMPEGASLIDNGDGTAVFTFLPDFFGGQRLASVTFKAFDGIAIDKEVVLIQIYDAGNQAPVFDSIPTPMLVEGETLVQGFSAQDPDHDEIHLSLDESVVTLPTNAEFVDLGLGLGTITFSPDFTQAGIYDISVVAWDGPEGDSATLSDTIVVSFDVTEFGNHLPVFDPQADTSGFESIQLAFTIRATDIDGDLPVLSVGPLPANAGFGDNGNGTGNFTFTPDNTQAGDYAVMFFVNDGTASDSMLVNITIADVNQLPFAFNDGNKTIYETDTLVYIATSLDADGTIPYLTAFLSETDSLATNMTFVDNRDGTGTLTFIPDYSQGGSVSNPIKYNVLFEATDFDYPAVSQRSAPAVISVIDRNEPPSLLFPFPGGPGPYSINEGEQVQFYIAVIDPDAVTPPSLNVLNAPDSNFIFTYDANARIGQFTFNPDFVQAGNYLVSFVATDDRGATATQVVQIDVLDAGNQAPTFGEDLADTLMVPAGHGYEIMVTPFDPEYDSITVEAFPMLPGATWTETEQGSWIYAFSADSTELGNVYEITFVVTDYPSMATDTLVVHPRIVAFLRGDLDADNVYSVNDIAYFIEYFFRNGPAPVVPETADINSNGSVTISDLSYLIYYMFKRGPQPAP